MRDPRRVLENASVLLVVILSAPLAALLAAVFATYLWLVFFPDAAAAADAPRDLFLASYGFSYLAICAAALRGK